MNGEQSVRIVYISKASSIDTIQTFWKRKIGAPGVRSNYLSSATDFFPFLEHLPWDRLCAVWQRPSVPLERSTCCTLFRFYWSYTGQRLKVKWTKCWQLDVEMIQNYWNEQSRRGLLRITGVKSVQLVEVIVKCPVCHTNDSSLTVQWYKVSNCFRLKSWKCLHLGKMADRRTSWSIQSSGRGSRWRPTARNWKLSAPESTIPESISVQQTTAWPNWMFPSISSSQKVWTNLLIWFLFKLNYVHF